MITMMIIAASIQPSVAMLRADVAELAWRQCIVMLADEMKMEMPADVYAITDEETKLSIAKSRCKPMAEDYRNALPDKLMVFARKQGLNQSGAEAVVETIVDQVFKETEASLLLTEAPTAP